MEVATAAALQLKLGVAAGWMHHPDRPSLFAAGDKETLRATLVQVRWGVERRAGGWTGWVCALPPQWWTVVARRESLPVSVSCVYPRRRPPQAAVLSSSRLVLYPLCATAAVVAREDFPVGGAAPHGFLAGVAVWCCRRVVGSRSDLPCLHCTLV